MKTYKITGETNGWIADRDAQFNGRTNITIEAGLSLKEAQEKLLDMYNRDYADERGYCSNWGLAVIQSRKHCFGATATFNDGTRCYDYDSRTYTIEECEVYTLKALTRLGSCELYTTTQDTYYSLEEAEEAFNREVKSWENRYGYADNIDERYRYLCVFIELFDEDGESVMVSDDFDTIRD